MSWDKKNWQGKSEEQIKYSYYTVLISIVILTVMGLYFIFKN